MPGWFETGSMNGCIKVQQNSKNIAAMTDTLFLFNASCKCHSKGALWEGTRTLGYGSHWLTHIFVGPVRVKNEIRSLKSEKIMEKIILLYF